MEHTADISDKIFLELKGILKTLSESKSIEEFLQLNEKNTNLYDYIFYLKVHQRINNKISLEENIINKDEFITNNKLENFISEDIAIHRNQDLNNDELPEKEEVFEDQFSAIEIPLSVEVTENTNVKDALFSEEVVRNLEQKHNEDKKIHLSNIKGIKNTETLFQDELFENNNEVEKPSIGGSLKNSNVPLDFMEAEVSKLDFKLDLNDRIAFSKKLFSGNQSDLDKAVAHLNSFETLDEAKEYLSEIYYERKWEKEDEYAQRLWSLVENKFR